MDNFATCTFLDSVTPHIKGPAPATVVLPKDPVADLYDALAPVTHLATFSALLATFSPRHKKLILANSPMFNFVEQNKNSEGEEHARLNEQFKRLFF